MDQAGRRTGHDPAEKCQYLVDSGWRYVRNNRWTNGAINASFGHAVSYQLAKDAEDT